MSTSIMKPVLVALIASALMFFLSGSIAYANDTPQVCDADEKYYCSNVNYDSNVLGGWNINHRYYKGGRDGGANSWQLYYARDWYSNGSQWILQTDWGASGWDTNYSMSSWREHGSAVSIAYYAAVTMRTRYYECSGSCYYWCSKIMEHDLWTGSSLQFGTSDCASN